VLKILSILHVDIPRTARRGSDLPFESLLQEYLQFPHEYFFSYSISGVTVVNFVLQTTPEEEIARIKIWWRERVYRNVGWKRLYTLQYGVVMAVSSGCTVPAFRRLEGYTDTQRYRQKCDRIILLKISCHCWVSNPSHPFRRPITIPAPVKNTDSKIPHYAVPLGPFVTPVVGADVRSLQFRNGVQWT
jgi:hypothetical protein